MNESVPRKEIKPPYHDRLTDYDPVQVQEIWEDSIELNVDISDPYFASTNAEYKHMVATALKAIARAKNNNDRSGYTFCREPFRQAPFTEQKVLEHLFRFEERMLNTHHKICSECQQCSLSLSVTKKSSVCLKCQRNKVDNTYNESNIMLPIWYDDEGNKQYEVPDELRCLTIAEILLIQRVAPLVPIVHIRNGTMGLKGHVCSFMQDISSVATQLPRLPSDVKAVKMVRTFKDAEGSVQTRTYMVNRQRVMKSIHWLIKYHRDYKIAFETGELMIDPSNLDWMGEEDEAELPSVAELSRVYESRLLADGERNFGVSKEQVYDPEQVEYSAIETSGMTCRGNTSLTNEAQDALIRRLREAAPADSSTSVLDWPQTNPEAISEYTDATRIFSNAFPHLFPGGIGDVNESGRHTAVKIADWAKHLLYFRDGRFARDPIWPFFAYNYGLRHSNTQSGAYFVRSHISSPPKTIDQLQAQLRSGDDSFVNKIMFYAKRTRGTDAYWRHKRAEVYNWIHHHVASGNGAPHLFMTLSCAEYFWPDLIRLLEERIWIAEGRITNEDGEKCYKTGKCIDLKSNVPARNRAVNEYSIVVQEFFIKRVEDWLNTVGKEVLGIKHYFCRLEFAKGRGQIHAHLLAILRKEMMIDLQQQLRHKNMTSKDEASVVASWADHTFGLSSTMPSIPENENDTR